MPQNHEIVTSKIYKQWGFEFLQLQFVELKKINFNQIFLITELQNMVSVKLKLATK